MCRILLLIVVIGACVLQSVIAAPPGSEELLPAALPPASSALQQPANGPVEPVPIASPTVPVDLRTALEWTLSQNPDLIAIRQNARVSQAALAVAQRFPTSLNPTVSLDARPWTFEKNTGQGARRLETQVSASWAQPIEVGGRTGFRTEMARAGFTQTQWNILQAELAALVETYRFHQTATYRREKLRVAQQLADFNRQLVKTVERQMQANQVSPVDVALAEVESQSTEQQKEVARQDYIVALTGLRQQIGIGDYMGSLEPCGLLQLPEGILDQDEDNLICTALENRPEVHAAQAQVAASRAAVCLARADRIPIFSAGPVYEKDESGTSFYGFAVSTPVPVLNAGRTLVSQREAEYSRDLVVLQQTQQRITNQVKATLIRWHQAQQLVSRTQAMMKPIHAQANRVDRLYAAGQSDLLRLLQVRQRLIQAENTQLDALWQATQAYADLLAALGCTPLIGSIEAESAPPANPPSR
jgi:cobalt-zinc-cadmium efflux system outer membrane protein